MREQVLQGDQPHNDQERATEHLAAAFDVRWNRPSEENDEAGAQAKQDRVSGRKAERDAERPGAARHRGSAAGIAVNRQRRDRHQVIGAQTVQEAQGQGRDKQKQDS